MVEKVEKGLAKSSTSVRRGLLVSASMTVAALGGYARGAYAQTAGCQPQGGATYLCTGASSTPQRVAVNNATVTTAPGFSVVTTGGAALTVTGDPSSFPYGSGDLVFTDPNASVLNAGTSGTGLVVGDRSTFNSANTVRIDASTTIVGTTGIAAEAGRLGLTTGSVAINVSGDVTGLTAEGIRAYSGFSRPGGIAITSAGTVAGASSGIYARGLGTGSARITSTGDVTGTGEAGRYATLGGIVVSTGPRFASSVTVATGAGATVRAVGNGISASSRGDISISTGGDVTATSSGRRSANDGNAIIARNSTSYSGGTVSIITAQGTTVSGEAGGIVARSGSVDIRAGSDVVAAGGAGIDASAETSVAIATSGDVTGLGREGIRATIDFRATGDVTVASNGTVTGASTGIFALSRGSGSVAVTATGDVIGTGTANRYANFGGIVTVTGSADEASTTITTGAGAAVRAVGNGILAVGGGDISISTGGDVTATASGNRFATDGNAIVADRRGNSGGGTVSIVTAQGTVVSGEASGIVAEGGTVDVRAGSEVVAAGGTGIDASALTSIAITANGDVTATPTRPYIGGTGVRARLYGLSSSSDGIPVNRAITITTDGSVAAAYTGIRASAFSPTFRPGEAPRTTDIAITTEGAVTGGTTGISVSSGPGTVSVTANGDVTATRTDRDGFRGRAIEIGGSSRAGGADVSVATAAGTTISGAGTGISVQQANSAVVTIGGNVRSESSDGIAVATTEGATGGVSITIPTSTTVDGAGSGIVAASDGSGPVEIDAAGSVRGRNFGIVAQSGTELSDENGSFTVTPLAGEGRIAVSGDVEGGQTGIGAGGFGVARIDVADGASVTGADAGVLIAGPVATVTVAPGEQVAYDYAPQPFSTTVTVGSGAVLRGGSNAIKEVQRGDAPSLGSTNVVNSGLIDGDVMLGGGADRVELRPGGQFNGLVDGGNGDGVIDAFVLGGASIGAGVDATVTAANADFDNDGATASGVLGVTGFERFEKVGTSTFEITGDNAEAFDLAVRGGGIVATGALTGANVTADAGTLIGGGGAIGSLRTAGTLAPGAVTGDGGSKIGTLNAAGDVRFEAGSIFAVQVAPDGRSDRLVASGSVAIATADTTLVVTPEDAASVFPATGEFTVITAADGVTGEFATLREDVPDIQFRQEANANSLRLVASADPNGRLSPKFGTAANAVGGARATGLFTDALAARGPVPGAGVSTAGVPAAGDSFVLSGSLGGVALGGALQAGAAYPADAIAVEALPAPAPLYAVFGTLFGGASDVDTQGARPGYDTGTLGAAVGVETIRPLRTGALRVGVALGYSQTDTDTLGASGEVDAYHVGAFGTYDGGALRASAAVSYARLQFDSVRVPTTGLLARSDTDGDGFGFSGEVSYDVASRIGLTGAGLPGGGFEVRPFAGLDAFSASYDGFTERAPGLLNLAVAGDTVSTGFARAGVRLASTTTVGTAVVSPSVMVGYERAFGDLSATTSSSLATLGGAFSDRLAAIDEDSFLAGAGLSFGTDRVAGHVSYEGAFGSNGERHRGSIGLSVRF